MCLQLFFLTLLLLVNIRVKNPQLLHLILTCSHTHKPHQRISLAPFLAALHGHQHATSACLSSLLVLQPKREKLTILFVYFVVVVLKYCVYVAQQVGEVTHYRISKTLQDILWLW